MTDTEIKQLKKEKIKKSLLDLLENIESKLLLGEVPTVKIKSRTKENLEYSAEGLWFLSDSKYTKKTLKTKGGAKEMLKLVHAIVYLLNQLDSNKSSTLREFYYNALNWIDEAKFEKINESNLCLQNLEILLESVREDFNIYPEAEGSISGPLLVEYTTRSGTKKTIHCAEDVGSTGFVLPRSLDQMKVLKCDADFVLVMETGGLFSRLIEENFDKKHNCILVLTKGHASRMTRKFIKMMRQDFNLKAAIFTDGDPYGFRIARSIIEGSIKASHLSKILCTPDAVHIGLFPSQIEEYKLPTDNITKLEKEAIDHMTEDFRFEKCPEILEELKKMREAGVKAEQQALSYYGLTFVTENYLPKVLKQYNFIP